MEITTVGGAFYFAMIGFAIVMVVLAIVFLCITIVMKLEPVLFKEKKKNAVPVQQQEGIDSLALVLISAAVAAHYSSFRIQNIRIGKRKDTVWNEIGRSSHHASHVIK